MKYVIVIEPGSQENPDFGVIIPDLPGCYSQGDDLDEAIKNAHEAACLWIDTALDEGMQLPHASTFSELQRGIRNGLGGCGLLLTSISVGKATRRSGSISPFLVEFFGVWIHSRRSPAILDQDISRGW